MGNPNPPILNLNSSPAITYAIWPDITICLASAEVCLKCWLPYHVCLNSLLTWLIHSGYIQAVNKNLMANLLHGHWLSLYVDKYLMLGRGGIDIKMMRCPILFITNGTNKALGQKISYLLNCRGIPVCAMIWLVCLLPYLLFFQLFKKQK